MSKFLSILFAGILVFSVVPESHAAESSWAVADQVRARLVSGAASEAVLDVELSEGWHSYWRVSGDAGLPPKFDWATSENVESVDIGWPYPKRFEEAGMITFGYEGQIRFPLLVHAKDPAAPIKLNGLIDIMVCKDICIPQQLNLSLVLDGPAGAQLLELEMAKRSIPKIDGPLVIDAVIAGPDALVITATAPKDFTNDIDAFAIAGTTAFTAKPELTLNPKEKRKAMIKIAKPADVENLSAFLAGKEIDIVLVAGGNAAEKIVKF